MVEPAPDTNYVDDDEDYVFLKATSCIYYMTTDLRKVKCNMLQKSFPDYLHSGQLFHVELTVRYLVSARKHIMLSKIDKYTIFVYNNKHYR